MIRWCNSGADRRSRSRDVRGHQISSDAHAAEAARDQQQWRRGAEAQLPARKLALEESAHPKTLQAGVQHSHTAHGPAGRTRGRPMERWNHRLPRKTQAASRGRLPVLRNQVPKPLSKPGITGSFSPCDILGCRANPALSGNSVESIPECSRLSITSHCDYAGTAGFAADQVRPAGEV